MTGDKDLKIWEGIYQSFADARGDTGVFEQNVWLEKVMDRARSALTASRGDVSIAPVAETREYALPFIAAVAAQRGVRLRILDFGGGLGSSFIPLVKMLPTGQELEFVIVENEAICKAGDELFANDSRVRFRSDIPPSDEHYEIVHCGSSISLRGRLDRGSRTIFEGQTPIYDICRSSRCRKQIICDNAEILREPNSGAILEY